MSIFKTDAPQKITEVDQAYGTLTNKPPGANIKGERGGAPIPQKDVKHVPNAGSKT